MLGNKPIISNPMPGIRPIPGSRPMIVGNPMPGNRPIVFPGINKNPFNSNGKIPDTNLGDQGSLPSDEDSGDFYDDNDSLNGDQRPGKPSRPEGNLFNFRPDKSGENNNFLYYLNGPMNGNLQKIFSHSPYLLINLPLLDQTTQAFQNGKNLTTKNRIAANFVSNDVLVTLLINYKFLFSPITHKRLNVNPNANPNAIQNLNRIHRLGRG